MWNYKTPGIPDESFERIEKVPITKEEVRTIAQSILTILHQTGTVYVNLSKKQVGLKISIRTIDTELKLILNELKSLINEI